MANRSKPHDKHARNLSAKFVRKILSYNPETGTFAWLVNRPAKGKKGAPAGSWRSDGRLVITINQRHYFASQIAWLYMNGRLPGSRLDHENGNSKDNKWENIRKATHTDNMRNSKKRAHSRQPYKGVKRHHSRWLARITCNRIQWHLGVFDTAEEAHAAYCTAAKKMHGRFSRFE